MALYGDPCGPPRPLPQLMPCVSLVMVPIRARGFPALAGVHQLPVSRREFPQRCFFSHMLIVPKCRLKCAGGGT